MDTTLSAADIALLNRGDNGFGGDGWGGFMWIFALLILAGGGFGGGFGWGNNGFANAIGYENLATSNEVQRGFDNQNSMSNQRDILAAVNSGTAQAVAATNQTFHDTIGALSDKYSELARDIAGVAVSQQQAIANQNECCCNTRMAIMETGAGINAGIAQNRYEAAMNTAAINATTTAQTQKILDAIAQDKIDSLQQKVNALELQNAVAMRMPRALTAALTGASFAAAGAIMQGITHSVAAVAAAVA